MKKFSTAIFSFLLVLLCTLQVSAADFSGSGTASNPYLIQNLNDLKTFAKSVYDGTSYEGKYFKQTADIVVNENVIKSDGTFNEAEKSKFTSWVPAGHIYGMWTENSFSGNYDGGNHFISGLYFGSDLDEPYVGLFGEAKGALLQNITIKDSYMGCTAAGYYNDNYHGFLVGLAFSCTIMNCHVSNSVMDVITNREVYSGGLVGAESRSKNNTALTMKDCSFSGKINVQTQSSDVYVAGLLGSYSGDRKQNTTMTDCSVEGSLNLTVDFSKSCDDCYVSGFGNNADGYHQLNMSNCVNRMSFNVLSTNFIELPNYNIHHEDYRKKFKHLEKLRIYPMCERAGNMINCANFGDVSIGTSNQLGNVDDIIVAPVGYISSSMKSCAFYGLTRVGKSGYYYHWNGQVDTWGNWHKLFTLKVYTVAQEIENGATIEYVLRREDGSTYTTKEDSTPDARETVYYLKDKDNVPSGVTFYDTTNLDEIINNAQDIINSFTYYDHHGRITYKWGRLTAGTFAGCPVPTVLGGKDDILLGSGTKLDPYHIATVSDYNLAVASCNSTNTSNKYYELLADIDLSNSEEVAAIGTSDHPFKGHFLGNGHSIIGMKAKSGSMFGEVDGGEVQDLTLLGMTCNGVDACFPLVKSLTNQGKIQNCYVGGDINVKLKYGRDEDSYDYYVTGLCGELDDGQIKDCYFKGKFNLDGDGKTIPVFVSGFAKAAWSGSITNSYSSFNVSATNGCSVKKVYGVAKEDWIGEGVVAPASCYFMTDYDGVDTQVGTQAKNYAELNEKMVSPFIKGVYNPVLPGTKSYALTDGRGLDALVVDGEGTGDMANVILHYVPSEGEDYENDRYLWQHPNLAVYNASDDAEYLINCTLDPAKDLQLNMDQAESQTIKANMHYPLAIYLSFHDHVYNKPLLQMLCLPVTVQRKALPRGSKLKVASQMATNDDGKQYMSSMVECDSVPAGVPFLLEIPSDACSTLDETYDLVLRGEIAPEPVSTIKVGDLNIKTSLKGTFKTLAKAEDIDVIYDKYEYNEAEGCYMINKESKPDTDVAPFHAYAQVANKDYSYKLYDKLLLDEESTDVASLLDFYNGKTVDVVLKRPLKPGIWNTICLPFDLTADEMVTVFGNGTRVEELARVKNDASDGATLMFSFTYEMKAGKTYLVRPTKSGTLYSFSNKLITNKLASEPEDAMYNTYFKGTYAPMLLEGTPAQTDDGYSYNYFIQGDKLYYLPEGQAVALKGFRGWILIASNSLFGSDGNATMAKLKHADGSATYVRAVEYGKTANDSRIYDLQGIEHSEMQKGVNIVGGKKIMK